MRALLALFALAAAPAAAWPPVPVEFTTPREFELISFASPATNTHMASLVALRLENVAYHAECDDGRTPPLTYCNGVSLELSAEGGRRFIIFGRPAFDDDGNVIGMIPEANMGIGPNGEFNFYLVGEPWGHVFKPWRSTGPRAGVTEIRATGGPVQINCPPSGTPYEPGTRLQVCAADGTVLFSVPSVAGDG